jgi:hypothetical protein
MGAPRGTLEERLWRRVQKSGPDDCWLWTGATTKNGYGVIGKDQGGIWRNTSVHRLAWELENGPIPKGLTIDHLCRVRTCVNPRHLEPVPHRVNLLRGDTLAARSAAKTHCPAGHPYDEANTSFIMSRGRDRSRRCKICHVAQVIASQKRNKG